MITIQTEIEVSTATLGDVAITAAEGGIGYWAEIQDYNWERWIVSPDDGVGFENKEVPEDFVFYTIRWWDSELGTGPGHAVDITPELLARGLGMLMRSQHVEDISGMDAIEADMVVQYGVFGELVYS